MRLQLVITRGRPCLYVGDRAVTLTTYPRRRDNARRIWAGIGPAREVRPGMPARELVGLDPNGPIVGVTAFVGRFGVLLSWPVITRRARAAAQSVMKVSRT